MGIYCELSYHLVWTTKRRAPSIPKSEEKKLFAYISKKTNALGGILLEIGGTSDHVHVVTFIPPSTSISQFVMRIKGASSHYLNTELNGSAKFSWQEGYGVISLSRKAVPFVRNYVGNQKKHHADGTVIGRLERVEERQPGAQTSGLSPQSPEGGK